MTKVDSIIKSVQEIVSPCYLVGGSVRDMILLKEPKDYDFTTPLQPDDVEDRVRAAGRRVYGIGKKFGTIGFKIDGEFIEVTTYREEVYSPNNRRPVVNFVDDLKDDLARRDFTMNAIAYNGDKLLDPFGGRMDIMERKIKSVGKASDRFKEDPLRMLRAARFASQLDFAIDPNMIGFMRKLSRSITTVSRERWVQELDKLLVGKNVAKGLNALADSYLLRYMFPDMWVLYNQAPDKWNNVLIQVSMAQDVDEAWLRWLELTGYMAAVTGIRDMGDGALRPISYEIVSGTAPRLKFSTNRTKYLLDNLK